MWQGHKWRVGWTNGEHGKGSGVHLVGARAGVGTNFNSGEGGDLIDLRCSVKHVPLPDAIHVVPRICDALDGLVAVITGRRIVYEDEVE